MRVTLNGKTETIEAELTVADLLTHLDLEPVRVAVEINEDVVSRGRYTETPIREDDKIEIVTFVGGG